MDIAERYHALDAQVYPWFEAQWQRVVKLHDSQHLPHALLINGMPGLGKQAFAEALAGYVICHQPRDGRACGQCRSCQLLNSSGHPDLYFLAPSDSGKAIKVDQIRELSDFMHSTAQQGGYRVVILNPAEAMNTSAANALLKTLEEPGNDVLLILITHQLGQVMPTIKSRCQRVDCHPPQLAQATQWMVEQLELSEDEAVQLLDVVHGAPLAAIEFKEAGHRALRGKFLVALKELLQDKSTPFEVAASFHKEDVEALLSWLQGLLADVSRIKVGGAAAPIRNRDVQKMLNSVAKYTSKDRIFTLVDTVQQERLGVARRQNPNKQLMLERILIDWRDLVRTE